MRLSTRARYTLRVMIALARMSGHEQPVSLAKLADRTQIPYRYLEKLVTALKKASLVHPVQGRAGGYLLALPAGEVRIGQIIEAGIGPINIVKCVKRPESCLKSDCCECRYLYMQINNRILQVLNEYSLADIADPKWRERISSELALDEMHAVRTSAQTTRPAVWPRGRRDARKQSHSIRRGRR
ncbi:Rrf2 family transcriptional regulator [Candidatus Sumerlaeota bacterium]|nr:Rrf2 family transcriptional regulator [Candidatus Sumerlaeota bacterium]